jgi:lysophospholipase L1-like esterase
MSLETATQGAALSESPAPNAEGAQFPNKRPRFGNRRSWGWAILLAICVAALVDWLSAGTQRLYVDEDSAANQQEGTVWQHFGVRGNEVVPEIISRDEARFTFPLSLRRPRSLRFAAHPDGAAEYEIVVWRSDGSSRKLASRKIDQPRVERVSVPAGVGELKFIVHGRIAWLDLRLVRPFYWPAYLGAFFLVAFALKKDGGSGVISARAGNWLALGASSLLCLGLIEIVLRLVALKLPTPILNARRDLGLLAPDPRWIDSPRYRQRLRPNLKTYCDWEHGDIARMGFIRPELFGPEKHRYPFETDADGFRNAMVREEIDVAALGDSFVDGMTSPAEETWPARLEQITGKRVQNYGTSSFGPQQELYVLQDFAIRRKPRDVVLGFFAGNDFFDAERFDSWERGGNNKPGEEAAGWRLKKKLRRYETFYLATLARVALPSRGSGEQAAPRDRSESFVPRFDRGRFEIPTQNAGLLRFAFMPPYLQKLSSSRQELEGSRGWELIRATLLQMHETCRQQNSRLTVMFIPSKAEVYWPLVARSLSPEELQRALEFASLYNRMPLRAANIEANRRSANELLRDFCAGAGISFLDLTTALEQKAVAGRPVYFADDAHWNAAGHEVAAQELAKFLSRP